MKIGYKGLQAPILMLSMALLTACITTKESVYTSDVSSQDAMEKRVELARRYISAGDWGNAERNLKQASALKPNSPEVHEAFALLYQRTGEDELAEKNFRQALSLDRKFSRARNNYAAYLYQHQRYKEAEEQLVIVVSDTLYTGRPQALVNLGLCRMQLKKYKDARVDFERALTLDRTNAIALLEMAFVEYHSQRYDVAKRYYEHYRMVVKQPSARALWLGVKIAHAQGDSDTAASHALALRNLYPKSAEFRSYQEAKERGEFRD